VHAQHLSASSITRSIVLMGVIVACQFPLALYQAGLAGRQRQVLLNGITTTMVTIRTLGAVVLIWRVAASIELMVERELGRFHGVTHADKLDAARAIDADARAKNVQLLLPVDHVRVQRPAFQRLCELTRLLRQLVGPARPILVTHLVERRGDLALLTPELPRLFAPLLIELRANPGCRPELRRQLEHALAA